MNQTRKPTTEKLAEIYHSIREITGNVNDLQTSTEVQGLKNKLQQVESKLSGTQKQILETIIEGTIEEYQLAENTSTEKQFGLKEAVILIREVEKKALEWNMSVIIAVHNEAAHPIAVHCMDHAYIASYDIAYNKAFTSAALKMSTAALKKLSQPGQELYGIQFTNQGRIVIFGGGVPLILNGKLIGALGVSGGTEEQDTMLAEYGSKRLEEIIKW